MKVELDLSTEQLESLDKDLTDLLKNLSEEQRIEILKGYIIDKFDKLEHKYTDHWGTERTQLSQFGDELVKGLQDKISESVSEEIMNNVLDLDVIKKTTQNIKNQLPEIIENSISQYIVDNLFNNKQEIGDIINSYLWNIRNNNNGVLR